MNTFLEAVCFITFLAILGAVCIVGYVILRELLVQYAPKYAKSIIEFCEEDL